MEPRSIAKALSVTLALASLAPMLPAQAQFAVKISRGESQIVAQKAGTIVDVASSNPNFSILVEAVKAAGLVETLSGATELTVFAPTNAAFEALPEGTLAELLKPENKEKLKQILTYHVVPGDLKSKSLSSGQVKTVEGNSINVMVQDGKVKVNDANVVSADIDASNGVIHVIDKVILPPNM